MTMLQDLKESAVAFVYAWAIILVPVFSVAYVVDLANPPQEMETI